MASRLKENPDLDCRFDYHQLTALLAHAPQSVEAYLKNVLVHPMNQGQISQCVFALLDQPLSELTVKAVVGSLVNYTDSTSRGMAINTIMGAVCHHSSGLTAYQDIILGIISESDLEIQGQCGVFNSVLKTLVSISEHSLEDYKEFEATRNKASSVFQSIEKLGIQIKKGLSFSPSPLVNACMLLDQEGSLSDTPNRADLVIGLMVEIWPKWRNDIDDPRISSQCRKAIMAHPSVRRGLLADVAQPTTSMSAARPPKI